MGYSTYFTYLTTSLVLSLNFFVVVGATEKPLTKVDGAAFNSTSNAILELKNAIEIAQTNDEWLQQSQALESRLNHLSRGASALEDPTINVSLLNLPTDGFALNQEPMTQFKVGASQRFSRGNTLKLRSKKYRLAAQEQPLLRADRRQQVKLQTIQLWLDAYQAQACYKLVLHTQPLFSRLKDIIQASYASSSGSAAQEDIIRAELELAKLNDRLIRLEAQQNVAVAQLSQFLFDSPTAGKHSTAGKQWSATFGAQTLPDELPLISETSKALLSLLSNTHSEQFYSIIVQHPLISASEQRVKTSAVDIEIAQQEYKPQFELNSSYAVRDDTPEGQSRADFFSIGVSISLPLFSNVKQDSHVKGSTQMTQALKLEKSLQIRALVANIKSTHETLLGLGKRRDVYQQTIIPQIQQQAESALNSYTNDTGQFINAVKVSIEQLDAQLTLTEITVGWHKTLASLHYLLPITDEKH